MQRAHWLTRPMVHAMTAVVALQGTSLSAQQSHGTTEVPAPTIAPPHFQRLAHTYSIVA